MFSAFHKGKFFPKIFSKNSNLDDSGKYLPGFPIRTNLSYITFATLELVKKIVVDLDFCKASGRGCVPAVVLKNCKTELSYISANLFNMCLKESFFPDCSKISSVSSGSWNVGQRSIAINYHSVKSSFCGL